MASLNKVLLIGRLTRDPETRYTPSGTAVTEFGLAVNRYFSVNGERREETCFLEVNAWGRLGEQVRNYLRKGRQVFVEGRLTYSEWKNQEGQKRSRIRVTAETVQFLDSAGKPAGGASEDFGTVDARPGPAAPPPGRDPGEAFPGPDETGPSESEVPF